MDAPNGLRQITFRDAPAWRQLGERYPTMPKGRCFINAYRLTRMFPELRYAEGTAVYLWDENWEDSGDGGKRHAWNVTPDGDIVDATWRNDGLAYEGVVFPRELINRIALETGFRVQTALDWLQERSGTRR